MTGRLPRLVLRRLTREEYSLACSRIRTFSPRWVLGVTLFPSATGCSGGRADGYVLEPKAGPSYRGVQKMGTRAAHRQLGVVAPSLRNGRSSASESGTSPPS